MFLDAYRQHKPVHADEIKAMPYLALGFWLFYMGFHTTHDQFYPFVFNAAHLKMRTAFIRQLLENWEAPVVD